MVRVLGTRASSSDAALMRRGTAAGNLHMHGALGRPYDRSSTVHAALKHICVLGTRASSSDAA